ncbi:hypothetical protein KKF91_08890 [Myxococcota bacterium]|nr:hypothetical protein [Myxococcota bacterium]MBU1430657.1 hypothetical protein [Myxococcota bacterium]MBU1898607.1 hypothetical protein [Myxococcota bacterium]
MKALAFFGGLGTICALLFVGPAWVILGNLALLALTGAIFLGTLNLEKGDRPLAIQKEEV